MSDLLERLAERTKLKYIADCKCGRCTIVPMQDIAEAADEITALRARLEAVEKDRDALKNEVIYERQEYARLYARAERAEAALAAARRDAEPYIIMIGPYRGVCVGGRWNNWLFHKHADGHWVSQQKLASESLSSGLANEASS